MKLPLTPVRFKRQAARAFPNKVGLVCGETRLTYAAYCERIDRLSNALIGLGVKKGDRVAWLGYNCHRLLEAYYGVVQMGAVLLPLNIRTSPAEIGFVLDDSGSSVLFYDRDFGPVADIAAKGRASLKALIPLEPDSGTGYEAMLAGASPQFDAPAVDDDDLAELFYTSGTTADPKGVMLTHRNLYLHALQVMAGLAVSDSTVQLHTIPLFHVNGWGTPHSITCAGGKHVVMKRFDPVGVLKLVEGEKVTHFSMVPTMATALVNHPAVRDHDLSSLDFIMLGGAATPPDLVREVEQTLGCRCYAGYGQSETAPVLTVAFLKDHLKPLSDQERWARQASTGYPLPGVELDVFDADDRPVPHDGKTPGEIVVRADNVMAGYWNRPAETDQTIRGGWLHTGDMAVVDHEGYLMIVDRKKDIIISGGENISSIEVEKAIYAHPAVLECAVIAVPDPQWGEAVKALVVVKPGSGVDEQGLIHHCKSVLAGFKVPRSVEFLPSLPKGGTGKILKKALREPYWTGLEKRVH